MRWPTSHDPELDAMIKAIGLARGFVFGLVVVDGPADELAPALGVVGAPEIITHPDAALPRLLSGREPEPKAIVILDATADFAAWEGALLRLNERRNHVTSQFGGKLFVAVRPADERRFAEAAPDVWSIRRRVFRVAPASVRGEAATRPIVATADRYLEWLESKPLHTNAFGRVALLHLSDIHRGVVSHRAQFPLLQDEFYRDLTQLLRHDAARADEPSPVDLVLWSGDLSQTGLASQFADFDAIAREIEARVAAITGRRPYVLAVPGNHDVLRPDPTRAEVQSLCAWPRAPSVVGALWSDGPNPYRALIAEAFAPYVDWWRSRVARQGPAVVVREGLLPGDFAATIEVGRLRVGVVGLNTAAVQLTADDARGQLEVSGAQLAALVHDAPRWAAAHDVRIFMAHHPESWLAPGAREALADMLAAGRFWAELSGNLHEGRGFVERVPGAAARLRHQAPSLFGMEVRHDAIERRHGYALIQLARGPRRDTAELWPRGAVRTSAGRWTLGPDRAFVRADATSWFEVLRDLDGAPLTRRATSTSGGQRPPGGPTLEAVAVSAPLPSPPPVAGAPFTERSYVPRPALEARIRARLASTETPVLLIGPRGAGKSWLLRRAVAHVRAEDPSTRTAEVDLRLLDPSSLDALLAGLLTEIGIQLGCPLLWPTARQTGPAKARALMASTVLPSAQGCLVLVLDLPDELSEWPDWRSLESMLADWIAPDAPAPWDRLRLALVGSTTPALLRRASPPSSPFLVDVIEVPPLDADELRTLASRYRLPRSFGVADLRALVGGNAYWAERVLHAVSFGDVDVGDLAHPAKVPLFADYFTVATRWLASAPALADAYRHALAAPGQAPPPALATAIERLIAAGVADRDGAGARVTSRLNRALEAWVE